MSFLNDLKKKIIGGGSSSGPTNPDVSATSESYSAPTTDKLETTKATLVPVAPAYSSPSAGDNYKNFIGGNPADVGTSFQDILARRKSRMDESGNAVTDAIKKAGASAGAQTQAAMTTGGIRGGLAAKGAESSYRKSQSDSAKYLQDQRLQAEKQVANMGGTAAAMGLTEQAGMEGAKAAIPAYQNQDLLGGTVICTELYRQGLISHEVFLKDIDNGSELVRSSYETYIGYRIWAVYVAKWMRNSAIITTIVALFAIPWAEDMAGDKSILGSTINYVGLKLCKVIGKIYCKLNKGVIHGRGI
jgi:hypothetical protein